MLIRSNLESEGLWEDPRPLRAGQPTQAELEEDLRTARQKASELEAVLKEIRKENKKAE